MLATSPFEVYSYVIGAKAYDDNFNILASMGLLFIPLIVLIGKGIANALEADGDDAAKLLKRMYLGIAMYVVTVVIFVVPGFRIDVQSISYKPHCNVYGTLTQGATPGTYGQTGTTLDQVFSNTEYTNIYLPLGMQYFMIGASGATNSAIVSLACKTNVDAIQNTINTTNLTPQISRQLQNFTQQCYSPALAQFQQQDPDPSSYQTTMDNYGGQADLNWPGSHVLQSLYYGKMYPSSPVTGFPYSEFPYQYADYNKEKGVDNHGKWGYPSCQEWWSDPQYGLEHSLVQLVSERDPNNPYLGDVSIMTSINKWLAKVKTTVHLGSQVTPDDVVARALIQSKGNEVSMNGGFGNSGGSGMNTNSYEPGTISNSWLMDAGVTLGNQAFQGKDAVLGTMTRNEIAYEIPLMIAVMLALLLALGPVVIMLGGCKLGTIFSYNMILVGVISMPYVEKFIHYLEVSYHASSTLSTFLVSNYLPMYNAFTKMYMYGPLIYFAILSTAGVAVGYGMNNLMGGNLITGSSAEGIGKKI